MKNELERIRDQLKCSLNMVGLKGSAEWAVGELDRLAGMRDDYEAMRARILFLENAIREWAEVIQFSDLSTALGHDEEMKSVLAAPTVKAEQAQCEECGGNGAGGDHEDDCAAPSLPAAGSAVDRVVATAPERIYLIIGDDCPRDADFSELGEVAWCEEEAEQGIEYVRATLSAQQSAPERVSVPVELLEALLAHIEESTCTHDNTHRGGAIWEICDDCGAQWADDRGGKPVFKWPDCVEETRAILASHGRGEA